MGSWLLLGVDSLIACIAVGPIMDRRWSVLVPFALLFGVGDGGGYLLGTALHWSYPDSMSFLAPVVVAVIGVYWIAVAIISKRAAAAEDNPKARWGIWILPWLLSLDNITYGAVDGVSHSASVWLSALEQALSSIDPGRRRARDRHSDRVLDPGAAAPHVAGQRNRRSSHDCRGRRPARRRLT